MYNIRSTVSCSWLWICLDSFVLFSFLIAWVRNSFGLHWSSSIHRWTRLGKRWNRREQAWPSRDQQQIPVECAKHMKLRGSLRFWVTRLLTVFWVSIWWTAYDLFSFFINTRTMKRLITKPNYVSQKFKWHSGRINVSSKNERVKKKPSDSRKGLRVICMFFFFKFSQILKKFHF